MTLLIFDLPFNGPNLRLVDVVVALQVTNSTTHVTKLSVHLSTFPSASYPTALTCVETYKLPGSVTVEFNEVQLNISRRSSHYP